jgi:hypothetical protein
VRDVLKDFLEDNNLSGGEVKIGDDFHAFSPLLSPLMLDEKAVNIYESKREDLLKLPNERLRGTWI